jgi:hypothetical protein
MDSIDILVDQVLNFDTIRLGISGLLGVPLPEVLVVSGRPFLDLEPDTPQVLCEVQKVSGDFKQLISVYFSNSDFDLSDKMIGRFCEICSCICMVSDSSDNPLSMTLFKGVDEHQTVYLSPDSDDSDDVFIVDYNYDNDYSDDIPFSNDNGASVSGEISAQ